MSDVHVDITTRRKGKCGGRRLEWNDVVWCTAERFELCGCRVVPNSRLQRASDNSRLDVRLPNGSICSYLLLFQS